MITFRREYLDCLLEAHAPRLRGNVLDVGGRRDRKRGRFRPPLAQVATWKYLNPDPATQPDYVGTAEQLPAADGSVDAVVMTEVLEYVAAPAKALAEVHRVLAPGGFALISVPLLSPVHGDWQHDRQRFTKTGLRALADGAGFREIEITEMGGLGAVLFDLCDAAFGYGHPRPAGLRLKVLRKLIRAAIPLFWLLERLCAPSRPFVTTGYFLKLEKRG